MTFDVLASSPIEMRAFYERFEAFAVCRRCAKASTFILEQLEPTDAPAKPPEIQNLSLNSLFSVDGFVGISDIAARPAPEHLPGEIELAFNEGAKCLANRCWNAAAAMFRMCIDHATKPMLPGDGAEGLNSRTRRDLGLRLQWLFDQGKLEGGLRELAKCIQQDGNDGAHAGTLTQIDAEDLVDFTEALLERLYTEPERLRLAQERRVARRTKH